MKVLVVDDEEIKCVSLVDTLRGVCYDAVASLSGAEALEILGRDRFDVVVTDLRMPGVDGMDLLKEIKEGGPAGPEVIIMTAYGSIPMAVEAMNLGAFDFITKPFRNEELIPVLDRIRAKRITACESTSVDAELDLDEPAKRIVGNSPSMCEVRKMVQLCARSNATVLLTGETGTGKDLLANTIHELSHRHSAPFVKINCAALASHLIESELFGHEKGAFTGADWAKKGKIEVAEGGTIYLDDVDDIPMEQQVKLLRVIEERVIDRVGAAKPTKVDVRIIAATKKDLVWEIEKGTFRSDLYYRLNVLRISLSPLRERLDDLPDLVHYLLDRISENRRYRLDDGAMEFLISHSWPGNIRELAHTLERAYLVGEGNITSKLISRDIICVESSAGRFKAAVLNAERILLQQALLEANDNKSAAARSLGMKPSTFRDKLAKHNLS